MPADSLAKARAVQAKRAAQRRRRELKQAREWLRLMRDEAQARYNYVTEDEPRAKERKRKLWLHVRDEWHTVGTPRDDALREVRKLERSDA